jgi:hypothetical protein
VIALLAALLGAWVPECLGATRGEIGGGGYNACPSSAGAWLLEPSSWILAAMAQGLPHTFKY